jgi:hypothetical protein
MKRISCYTDTGKPILGAFASLQKFTTSFVMSVCLSAWNNFAPTGCIFMKFDTSFLKIFPENASLMNV